MYTFFFNKDFLQQEVNHCLQTNRPSLLHLRFFKSHLPFQKCIIMLWTQFLSIEHTGDFCLPFSVHSLKHLSAALSNFHCVEILKEIVYLSKSNVSLWCTYSLRYSSGSALNLKVDDLLPKC